MYCVMSNKHTAKGTLKGKKDKKGVKKKSDGQENVNQKVKVDRKGEKHKLEKIRKQDKIHKKEWKGKKKKKSDQVAKSDLLKSSAALFDEGGTNAGRRRGILHGLSSMPLSSKEEVRAMSDVQRHGHLCQMSGLCERLLGLMHSLLVSTDDHAANELPSVRDHVTADLVRLRHLPAARKCIEMTLWHHVARFNDDSMNRVQSVGYGALTPVSGSTKDGLMNHDEDVRGEVFNSFKNRYMSNILDTYQEDLDKIRRNEGLDEEHVLFLRRCLDAGADLYAHIRSWDRKHPLGRTDESDTLNKQTDSSGK